MSVSPLVALLPQLASASAHTHALGFTFDGVTGDRVRLKVPWREDLVGDPDTDVLAGGLVTSLLDHAGGMAVWVGLDRFEPIATLDLRVDYMRAARPRSGLIAEARCYRLTRSIAFVRAWAFEDDIEDPVAAAQSAYILNSSDGRGAGANLKPRRETDA
ncbi:PaaI family thioesterase [Brevundimonas sp. M20]|uniref:PaaI family thioesterase n=1 Tax=Brevundimonas sp. M20 TaxID=2591463 RepID=UPI001146D22B|nr:PaaI family thioesterase [Brevundimonas sp. M20]QDH73792.1 PaaI family thioesterase [Brevundimonas sp. M20]